MMSEGEGTTIHAVEAELREQPRTWLVTGVAGFVGSHLAERLLVLGQQVVGLDNFATGTHQNLDALTRAAAAAGASEADSRFHMIEADVRDYDGVLDACRGVDHVLHHAALASVPRTLAEPIEAHTINVDGTFHVLEAARNAGVRSVVHASSSAVYGDCPGDPGTGAQREERIGRPLSPYAGHKHIAEVLGETWAGSFGLPVVGLRYFNIVGARQDPEGAYAAVIPKWVSILARGGRPVIFGDGETTRDFCAVEDAVQANVLAATLSERRSDSRGDHEPLVFNVGRGGKTSLLELFELVRDGMAELGCDCAEVSPRFEDFRAGDIRHSRANIERTTAALGYAPAVELRDALRRTMRWLLEHA